MNEANNVREALAELLMSDRVMNTNAMGRDYALVEADAILAAFEVRPRGTVTDAEVGVAYRAYIAARGFDSKEWIRAALEAVREARA